MKKILKEWALYFIKSPIGYTKEDLEKDLSEFESEIVNWWKKLNVINFFIPEGVFKDKTDNT